MSTTVITHHEVMPGGGADGWMSAAELSALIGVPLTLIAQWVRCGWMRTDADGRLKTLTDGLDLRAGRYRLTFETGAWFKRHGAVSFHPAIDVLFEIANPAEDVHVPLLLSPFGYTTYRGS